MRHETERLLQRELRIRRSFDQGFGCLVLGLFLGLLGAFALGKLIQFWGL